MNVHFNYNYKTYFALFVLVIGVYCNALPLQEEDKRSLGLDALFVPTDVVFKAPCVYEGVDIPVDHKIEATDCGFCKCTEELGLVCDVCEDCLYHGIRYEHHDTWWEMCNECECHNSTIICMDKDCPNTCEWQGVTKLKDQTWAVDCNTCTCTSTGISCTDTVCSCMAEGDEYIHSAKWYNTTIGGWCMCDSGVILGDYCT